MRIVVTILIFICCSWSDVCAQKNNLDSLTRTYQNWRKTTLEEKIFIHTDRSSYLTGETIWLKVYRVEAATHSAIDWSRVVYVELLDKNKLPALQVKFLIDKNGCDGSIFLPASLSSGNYVLRAYTNWMKNSGPAFFFHQTITVLNPFIPLELSSDTVIAKYDAQFFPEGGDLVYGLESVVGVRVADKSGYGIQFKGAILNERKDTVERFASSNFGLGKFRFLPQEGYSYSVVIRDNKNKSFHYPMPSPRTSGYGMQVKDSAEGKIQIIIRGKNIDPQEIYLLAHTRQILKVQQRALINNGIAKFVVDKELLGPGVSSFTIFDSNLQPICERLYFKKPEKKLVIALSGNPYSIKTREKVKLDMTLGAAKDSLHAPAFSIAVYKIDSLDLPVQNIADYFWLTSDLSGTVENPSYYFGNETPKLLSDIDNLMLTHGWRRFDWNGIMNGQVNYSFLPEIGGHLLFGKLTEVATGKPANSIPVYLSFMGTPINVYVSESQQGRLLFETEPILGNKSMIVQTASNVADQYRIEIEDPFFEKVSFSIPPFAINKKQGLTLEQRSIHMQVQNLFYEPMESKKPISGVRTFYGEPDETYQLDDYTRFPTLEEVMREYVPGIRVKKHKDEFHLSNIDLNNKSAFSSDPLTLVDGIPIFDTNKLMQIDPLKLKQLDVINRRYYLNALAFDGIVSYISYKGDLAGFQPPEHALLVNYKGLETKREFFTPRYDREKGLETMPDARRVLFWSAGDLPGSNNHRIVEFFTSDIAGEYKIVVQALSNDGLPGYYSASFLVR